MLAEPLDVTLVNPGSHGNIMPSYNEYVRASCLYGSTRGRVPIRGGIWWRDARALLVTASGMSAPRGILKGASSVEVRLGSGRQN